MLKHSEGKLCSYSKFKTYFGLEKYLCILKAFEQRRNFNRFHHQTWGNRKIFFKSKVCFEFAVAT
jgi:hypothetical protein